MDTRTIVIVIVILLIFGVGAWLVLPSSTFANKPVTPTKFIQFDATDYISQLEGNYTGSFETNVLASMANAKTTGAFEGYLFVNGTRRFARVRVNGVYTGLVYGYINKNQLSGGVLRGSISQANVSGALEVQDLSSLPSAAQGIDSNFIILIAVLLVLSIGAYFVWKNIKTKEWEDYEDVDVVDEYIRPQIQAKYHRKIKCFLASKSIPQEHPKIRKMFYECFNGEIFMVVVHRGKKMDVQFNMTYPQFIKELEEKSAFVRPYDDNVQTPAGRRPTGRPASMPLPKISKSRETEYRYNPDQK
jgi:hypothetical protein